ncbi:MAG: outer membrane protein assembly factor BamD [Rickettsiales bacterium]
MKFKFFLSIIFCLFLMSSCQSSKKDVIEVDPTIKAEDLYNSGVVYLKKQELKKASEYFGRVAYEYPYHKLANKSEVMEIYVNYLMAEYENVFMGADEYIKMHPASDDIPYIMYLKALSNYEQIDVPYRDQEFTRKAKKSLLDLIKRFPKSKYAKDAKVKLDLVNDHLAAHEMVVGRYYQNNGKLLSAIKRFKNVIDKYDKTSHVQEALYRVSESYVFLDMKKEAKRNASVLGYNYPSSKWYKKSYNLLKK